LSDRQLTKYLAITQGQTPESGPGSVVGIATGYGLDGPGIEYRWRRDFSHLSRPALGPTHPPSCTMGTGSFLGVKGDRGVTLSPHPLLVPWSRKSRAKPLLLLWAVRPVQSLSACTRVHFTFYLKTPEKCTKRELKPVRNSCKPFKA